MLDLSLIHIFSDIREGNEMIEKLEERLQGRFAVNDILDPATGEVLVSKDKMMSEDDAKAVVAAGIKEVEIRSVLCCDSKHGVCSKCYGANLANGRLVGMGEAVGIIAAQSIGEPGTQLTMRTFHTGCLLYTSKSHTAPCVPSVVFSFPLFSGFPLTACKNRIIMLKCIIMAWYVSERKTVTNFLCKLLKIGGVPKLF